MSGVVLTGVRTQVENPFWGCEEKFKGFQFPVEDPDFMIRDLQVDVSARILETRRVFKSVLT